jgi:hypothetical protein
VPDSVVGRIEQPSVGVGVKQLRGAAFGSYPYLLPKHSLQAEGANLTAIRADIHHPIRYHRRSTHTAAGGVPP